MAARRVPRPDRHVEELDLLELFLEKGLCRGLRVEGESVRELCVIEQLAKRPPGHRPGEKRVELPLDVWRQLAGKRRAVQMTQQQMAEALDYSQACTVSEFETRRTRPAESRFRRYLELLEETWPLEAQLVPGIVEQWGLHGDSSRNARWRKVSRSRRADRIALHDLAVLDRDLELVPQAHRNLAFPRMLPVTEELCYFLGWFAAEGSLSGGQVSLSLGAEDERYVPQITQAIQKAFGQTPRVHTHAGRPWVRKFYFHSTIAAKLVVATGLGGKAHEKRLPDFLFNVVEECQLAFLEGYFLGDGTKRAENRLTFSTVSREFANGLTYLLAQLGIVASVSMRRIAGTSAMLRTGRVITSRHDAYTVSICGKDQLLALESVWRNVPEPERLRSFAYSEKFRMRPRWVRISDDLMALPVLSNEARPYEGWVYDFSVADDENFIAGFGGGLLAHNTDADVDGAHIRTLLLTFFFRHMPGLIDAGYIYAAQPPLYSLLHEGKKRYVLSDAERDGALRELAGKKVEIARFKGLGEMPAEELWETTMNPDTRILRRVTLEDAALADEIFTILMGENVESRRDFITKNAKYATLDV